MKNTEFSKNEIRLFEIIAGSFTDFGKNEYEKDADYSEIVSLAAHHSILPILYKELKKAPLSEDDWYLLDGSVKSTAKDFYQLTFIARKTIGLLEGAGIKVVLLKGASAARFYPVPESRRSADVDLLLANVKDAKAAGEVLAGAGYRRMNDEYEANHHQVWGTPDNHVVELHTILVEPFDDRGFNDYINDRYILSDEDILVEKILGMDFPVLRDDRQAFHLLLHMLMDFLRSGFGLKLFCDWVAFWNRDVEEKYVSAFLKDVEHCKVGGFLSAVTSTCIRYLGLRADGSNALRLEGDRIFCGNIPFCEYISKDVCDDFLMDIVDAEREGKPSNDRMVAMKDTGFFALVKEYHHQTVLTFPKASKIFITWPVLYVMLLVRFLTNNKKIRGGQSVRDVVKKANERSALVKKLKL